jgi:signal transduction histidine kinase/CheY-like chemotaxis protein/HPt (histidine-containing phosphotransfer) domain-containing protein
MSRISELENQYDALPNGEEKIAVLLDICAELRLFDVDKAFRMAENAKCLAIEENYPLGIGRSIYALGSCYWQKGDYPAAIKQLTESLNLAVTIKDEKLKAKSQNILGNVYRELGDISNAIRYYLSALEIYELQGDEHTSGVVMKNMSNLYYDLFDYEVALGYALRSMQILEKYENKLRTVSVYNTLGNIYFKKEEYSNALEYFYKCIQLTDLDTITYTLANSGLGKVYYKLGDHVKAKKYLGESLLSSIQNNYIESLIISAFYLGRESMDANQLEEALKYYNQAFAIAKEHSRKHDIMSIHEMYSQLYEKLGNIPLAFENLKMYDKIKEEIISQDVISRLHSLQVKHELEFANKEKEVAEHTAKIKQQFLANMSHEIRTPMNAIMGMSRALMQKEKLPHQEKYLHAIQQSADNLLVIINDILDVSKIEAGKIEIENIPFSLEQVVSNLEEIFRYKVQEKKLNFEIELEKKIPKILIGDPTRFSQVLINLIGNAIKFTDTGGVKVKIVSKQKNTKQIQIRFDVIDTGIGISEDFVSNLFQNFSQAGSDTARKYGGSGLGLSICKQLVELMNGIIYMKSTLQHGSTFSFELPFYISTDTELLPEKTMEISDFQKNILAGLKILLVEDNIFNQMLAIDSLKDLATAVTIDTAENGKIAIEKAAVTLYDIILMDIQMPELNGIDATSFIRNKLPKPFSDVKIIAMTANVMQEDIKQYLQAGMNEYVGKPFTTELLVHTITKLIDPHTVTMVNSKEQETLIIPQEIKTIIDLNFLKNFTKSNLLKQKKYIDLYLQTAPKILAQAKEALASKNYEQLKVSVHSLKSQLNYMGVPESISNVYALEKASVLPEQKPNLETMFLQLENTCKQSFLELENVLINYSK